MEAYISLCGGFHGSKTSAFTILRLSHPEGSMCHMKRVIWACGCPQGLVVARPCPARGTPNCHRRHLLERMRITVACREHRPFTTLTRRRRRTPTRNRMARGLTLTFTRHRARSASAASSGGKSNSSSIEFLGSRPVGATTAPVDPNAITAESIFDPNTVPTMAAGRNAITAANTPAVAGTGNTGIPATASNLFLAASTPSTAGNMFLDRGTPATPSTGNMFLDASTANATAGNMFLTANTPNASTGNMSLPYGTPNASTGTSNMFLPYGTPNAAAGNINPTPITAGNTFLAPSTPNPATTPSFLSTPSTVRTTGTLASSLATANTSPCTAPMAFSSPAPAPAGNDAGSRMDEGSPTPNRHGGNGPV
ncbi:hypothetical protein C8A05DRAFT_35350 [Staphylotrichum tortipilum]|uniref:Uncharacterized protein n=1 Tax=Staphylotrichum tortipilum TaxID=2831512 RepID=A0AAN6MHX0_9PEZI|nr:hypothetical protein C8A05DRAFT_35350 [Staphylotrichum longicolle]